MAEKLKNTKKKNLSGHEKFAAAWFLGRVPERNIWLISQLQKGDEAERIVCSGSSCRGSSCTISLTSAQHCHAQRGTTTKWVKNEGTNSQPRNE